jgi:hypothetical protein
MSILLLFGSIPSGISSGVTDTTRLQLPVNCILASDSLYRRIIGDNHIVGFRKTERVSSSVTATRRLQGDASSFTTKTGKLGHD